ncbi:MAG: hypothetical protein NVSMB52_05800 [Chloroflexota bacterium]
MIILMGGLLALYWVFLVPILEAPDEQSHVDYVFSIYSSGGLLNARQAPLSPPSYLSHPWTDHLATSTFVNSVALQTLVRMPLSYGTARYYADIDRRAPKLLNPYHPRTLPWLLPVKPVAYYALDALWLGLTSRFTSSVIALFFAARVFSVFLLMCGLSLVYLILRATLRSRIQALFLLLAIGFFPLTSFASSYVQPDSLSFTVIALLFYAAILVQRKPASLAATILLGCALGLLLITKYQFFLCVAVPVFAMLATRPSRGSAGVRVWFRRSLYVLPSLLLGGLQVWIHWGARDQILRTGASQGRPTIRPVTLALSHGPVEALSYGVHVLGGCLHDFLLGTTASSFWGVFGWLDTPLIIGYPETQNNVRALQTVITLVVVGLAVARMGDIARRLYAVMRSGRRRQTLVLLFSDPLMNSLFLFTVFMIVLYILTDNTFGAQGRDWYPLLLPIFLLTTQFAPRALRHRGWRIWIRNMFVAGLVLYSVVGGISAIVSVRDRFYCPLVAKAHLPPHAICLVGGPVTTDAPLLPGARP